MLYEKLEKIGLSDKEARIYAALLEMGKATAFELAQKSGVNRGTAYSILESLINKKLVIERAKDGVTDYACGGALNLLEHLENEKLNVERKLSNLRAFLPEIESLYDLTSDRVKAKFFSGQQGTDYIRKEFKKNYKGKEILNIFNATLAWKIFPIKKTDYRQKLKNHKMNLKALAVYDPKQPLPEERHVYRGSERRFISQTKVPIFCEILIYDNWFSIADYTKELNIVIISHPLMVEAFKAWFRLAWDGAEKYMHFVDKG